MMPMTQASILSENMQSTNDRSSLSIEQNKHALSACFSSALQTDISLRVFGPYVTSGDHEKIKQEEICSQRLRDYYNSLEVSEENTPRKEMMVNLAEYIYSLTSPRYIKTIFNILLKMVKNGDFHEQDLEQFCRSLVEHSALTLNKPHHWCQVFNLIDNVVQVVSYKVCQHLLINTLYKMSETPCNGIRSSSRMEIKLVSRVIDRLLDRDKPLLPAYISLNEIRQIFEKDPEFWPLSKSMAKLEASFKPLSSFITLKCHHYIYPFTQYQSNGICSMTVINWQLDPVSFCWNSVKQNKLPFSYKDKCQKQYRLLNYLMSQRYTLDTIQSIIGQSRHSKSVQQPAQLDYVFVKLIISVMKTEPTNQKTRFLFWQHLQHLFVIFAFNKSIRIQKMMELLKKELLNNNLKQENIINNRDSLMWLLLQYIAGSVAIVAKPIEDFLPVNDLFNILYPEDVINLPHHEDTKFLLNAAPLCIFIHLKKGFALRDCHSIAMPYSLQRVENSYYQFEKSLKETTCIDNRLILIINVYYPVTQSNDQDYDYQPLDHLLLLLSGNQQIQLPGLNCFGHNQTRPLSVTMLDSITLSGKMTFGQKLCSASFPSMDNRPYPSPAIIQTFSRYFIYNDIETSCISFLIKNLGLIIKEKKYAQLQIATEVLKYQLSHLQADKIINALRLLVQALNTIPYMQLANSIRDLFLTFIPQLMTTKQFLNSEESNYIVSDSEELNKSIILALAQGIKTTNSEDVIIHSACESLLDDILNRTPLSFPHHTISQFPPFISNYLERNQQSTEKDDLIRWVEDEFRNFQGIYQQNEAECIARFTNPQGLPVFICIVWKILQTESQLPAVVFKILEKFNFNLLSNHVRTFADFLIEEFQAIGNNKQEAFSYIDILIQIIWDYQIISFDMFIHILIFRPYTGCDVILIIQLLVNKPQFTQRVEWMNNFASNSWEVENNFETHSNYHKTFQDTFNLEILAQRVTPRQQPTQNTLPSYCGNVCHRMIPVLDQYFHRVFEMEMEQIPFVNSFHSVLKQCCNLYRFHPKPITYLYQTLYYYSNLSHSMKRTFTISILDSLDCKIYSFLSQKYRNVTDDDFVNWIPDTAYYMELIYKLVTVIDGVGREPDFDPIGFDWRFHEFTNPVHLTLYSICIEIMTLPTPPQDVGQLLFNVVTSVRSPVNVTDLPKWFNAVGLILSQLPVPYSEIMNQIIISTLSHEELQKPCPVDFPFGLFSLSVDNNYSNSSIGRIITCVHAIWSHMGIAKLTQMSSLLRDHVRPRVKNELQLLFICHLIGPFFARLEKERTRVLTEVVIELYQIILQISQNTIIYHQDTIVDLLYHIKYKHVGELMKNKIQQIIKDLPTSLKEKLKFLIRTRPPQDGRLVLDSSLE